MKLVLDPQGGMMSRVEHMPYGEVFVQKGDRDFAPKYNSQELDRETNYYFFNARYYDPEISRFVTADSVIDGEFDTQGWNRFAYVKGRPVVAKDPSGHLMEYQETKKLDPNPSSTTVKVTDLRKGETQTVSLKKYHEMIEKPIKTELQRLKKEGKYKGDIDKGTATIVRQMQESVDSESTPQPWMKDGGGSRKGTVLGPQRVERGDIKIRDGKPVFTGTILAANTAEVESIPKRYFTRVIGDKFVIFQRVGFNKDGKMVESKDLGTSPRHFEGNKIPDYVTSKEYIKPPGKTIKDHGRPVKNPIPDPL